MSIYHIQPVITDDLREFIPGTNISKYCFLNIYKKSIDAVKDKVLPAFITIGSVKVLVYNYKKLHRFIVKYSNDDNIFIFDY